MDYSVDYYTENGLFQLDFTQLKRILSRPYIKPHYRISILNYDESVSSVIPEGNIESNGISYTEEYQNGQRRNITLKLLNIDGKYTPSINNIWMDTKFKYEIGIEYLNEVIWFPKGIYTLGNIDSSNTPTGREVTFQLKDKFFIFDGKTGTLDSAYEIPVGSTIKDVIKGILNMPMGNGYVFDFKPFILDKSFENFK